MNFLGYLRATAVWFLSTCALCFSSLHLDAKSYKYDLAICAIFQNEAPYLHEWIEFHNLVGVKHFYLYNNLSSDDYRKVLYPYIRSGEVELFQWEHNTNSDGGNWPAIQVSAYDHAIKMAKKQAKWLAILDTDEFLFPVEVDSLPEFLLDFEDAATVSINWQMYGTSGVERILPGHLMIEDLIYKAPKDYAGNSHVKSIVRPKYVQASGPHYCVLSPGHQQVNANKEPISGPYSPVHIDTIRINHYWTRDEHFFHHVKIPRRQKWRDGGSIQRANDINQEVDTSIYKYLPRLRKALGI